MSNNQHIVRSKFSAIMMNFNISLGALNLGYVLSYLTLSMDTIFANLNIPSEEKTQKMSLLTGILPLGCVVGVLVGYILKKKFTNKQCIHIADLIGITSLLATIANYNVIVTFRFFLGVSNGISSLIVPIYVKSLCPQQYYSQMSMLMGYGTNTGLAIGQLMGIGYINYHGATSNWWRVVFLFPSIICILRSSIIHFIYNYDSPEQLIKIGNIEQAKFVICQIYKDEYVEEQYIRYEKIATAEQQNSKASVFRVFNKENFITLQVGIISMLAQIWCGFFAVIYYSGQIFSDLSDNNIVHKTIYTFSLGLAGFVCQFLTIFLTTKLGNKYILMIGALLMGILNVVIAVLSRYSDNEGMAMTIFFFLLLLIMIYASTLGPAAWSIVPQINSSDGTFVAMEHRWAFQAILIFAFPFIERDLKIFGAFILFAAVDFLYLIYSYFFLIDGRGKTNEQLIQMYQHKFGYSIVPIDNTQQNQQQITMPTAICPQNQNELENLKQNTNTNNQENIKI